MESEMGPLIDYCPLLVPSGSMPVFRSVSFSLVFFGLICRKINKSQISNNLDLNRSSVERALNQSVYSFSKGLERNTLVAGFRPRL